MFIILYFNVPFGIGTDVNLTFLDILYNLIFIVPTGFALVFVFQKAIKRTLSIPIQILLFILTLFFTETGSSGQLIYMLIGIPIIYFWGYKRSIHFNIVSSYFIFSTVYFWIWGSIWYRIFQAAVFVPFNPPFLLRYILFISLLNPLLSSIAFLFILKKFHSLIENYNQLIPIQWPIYSWIINLIACFFPVFRSAVATNRLIVPYFTFLIVLATYVIGYLLAMYFSTKSLQKTIQIENQRIELENLAQYTSHIEALYDELRRFRHDYKNILLSLNEAVENKNINQVSEIFKRVVIPTSTNVEIRTSVLSRLANVENLEIKSLLYSKTIQAIDKGVKVELEIENPIKLNSNVQITDMLRIISILFDNAINATTSAKHPQINLSYFNAKERHDQIFQIGNSTKEEQLNLNKLSGNFNGVLTNNRHGLGLRNLRSILARYPFIQNNRSSNDYWFEQQIIIYKVNKAKTK